MLENTIYIYVVWQANIDVHNGSLGVRHPFTYIGATCGKILGWDCEEERQVWYKALNVTLHPENGSMEVRGLIIIPTTLIGRITVTHTLDVLHDSKLHHALFKYVIFRKNLVNNVEIISDLVNFTKNSSKIVKQMVLSPQHQYNDQADETFSRDKRKISVLKEMEWTQLTFTRISTSLMKLSTQVPQFYSPKL